MATSANSHISLSHQAIQYDRDGTLRLRRHHRARSAWWGCYCKYSVSILAASPDFVVFLIYIALARQILKVTLEVCDGSAVKAGISGA